MTDSTAQLGALLRDAAIAQVEDAADEEWKIVATAAIRKIAACRTEFTTDHVWEVLADAQVYTHEHRAMGALMRNASTAGLIIKTDRMVPTRRPGAHRRPVAVWRSLCIK